MLLFFSDDLFWLFRRKSKRYNFPCAAALSPLTLRYGMLAFFLSPTAVSSLSWSPLFFFTNLSPVRPTYPFPPLFAACLSRLTLSFYAKLANVPFPAFLIPLSSPVSRTARTPQSHAWLRHCSLIAPSLKEAFLHPGPLGFVSPPLLLQLPLWPSRGTG